MNIFTLIYNEILFKPLLNLLIAIYNFLPWHDLGLAIIVVTIIIRLLLYPLAHKALKSQRAMQKLQPQINKLREEHKADKNAQAQKLMEFYKQNKINPLGSCLPLLLQLPIIFALYQVFRVGMNVDSLNQLYAFVARPEVLNAKFIGLISLTQSNVYLAVLAGAFQFWQSKMITPKTAKTKSKDPLGDMSGMLSKQMLYFMPVMTVFIGFSLPAGLTLYWVVTTLFAIGQQYLLFSFEKKEKNGVK